MSERIAYLKVGVIDINNIVKLDVCGKTAKQNWGIKAHSDFNDQFQIRLVHLSEYVCFSFYKTHEPILKSVNKIRSLNQPLEINMS